MSIITVPVTAAHIGEGERGRCAACPVALAIAEAIPGAALVSVCPARVVMVLGGQDVQIRTPARAAAFARAFDAGQPVGPFEFTLRLPRSLTR